MKNMWLFKGLIVLLTLEGNFFMFKFSCKDDYDMVWNNGSCFLTGHPFLFSSDLEISGLLRVTWRLLWIKMFNFPLFCWNEAKISKVASCVGLPLTIDDLTTYKSRITFAHASIQINSPSLLLDLVPINLNEIKFNQEILYGTKPNDFHTFYHEVFNCPIDPSKPLITCGRSRSRSSCPLRTPTTARG